MSARSRKRLPTATPLLPVSLTQVRTSDGVDLAGLVIEPAKKKALAVVYVHGLNGSFSSGQAITAVLGEACRSAGFGFFKFNTRGHDIAARAGTKIGGGGFETFTDCLKDIEAVIRLARRRGYRRFVLIGHSTGANKALYYAYKGATPLAGLVLTGPLSDRAGMMVKLGAAGLRRLVQQARRRYAQDRQALMVDGSMLRSAARVLSLYEPGHPEDVFQYYRRGTWSALRSVRCPLLVVVGQRDAHLDRPAGELIDAFAEQSRTKAFTSAVIPRADHGFHRHEAEVVAVMKQWWNNLL